MNYRSAAPASGVLIVDDHAISRRYLVAALRQRAWHVKQAAAADEGLLIALSWFPDIILVDLNLAGTNGLDLARRIRNSWPASQPRPSIIMLSADPALADYLAPAGDVVDGFLLKPVSHASLLDALTGAPFETGAGNSQADTESELQHLFRQELSSGLRHLDSLLLDKDLAGAETLLHRLIASSGLCRQPLLGRNLRGLDAACRAQAGAAKLAREYYSLLTAARACLGIVAGNKSG
jgi:CheY-like chemotaxis protein